MAATATPSQIPPLTLEEEDAIIHSRITNDEKVLKKVVKRFHNYASIAYPLQASPASTSSSTAVDDARDNFLIELASFHLSLKKAVLTCEAETRQVEEYEKEKEKIATDRHVLKGQIEQLKTSLEDAQLLRRRKIEYDQVAEKINAFPTREELQQSIDALENDIAAILSDHENQHRVMQSQKAALDGIISDIGTLRLMGKDTDVSRAVSPSPDTQTEIGEGEDKPLQEVSSSTPLNALAKTFDPPSRFSTPIPYVAQRQVQGKPSSSPLVASSPAPPADLSQLADDDIEMGELAEEPRELKVKRKAREELEEGEASDSSSELSDVPDDV